MSICDIELALKSISDQQKYHISKNHAEPTESLLFSTRDDEEYYRSFRRAWLNIIPWLVYIGTTDGTLYEVGSVFTITWKNSEGLVNKPLVKWHRKSEYLSTLDVIYGPYKQDSKNTTVEEHNLKTKKIMEQIFIF